MSVAQVAEGVVLAPVAMHFGIDPVHFGIVMVVNLALGMITPPFGVNLFAACTVARISLDQIVRHLLPFVLVILGAFAEARFRGTVILAGSDAGSGLLRRQQLGAVGFVL